MYHITEGVTILDILEASIPRAETRRMICHLFKNNAENAILSQAGRLVLNKAELDKVGVSSSKIKHLRELALILQDIRYLESIKK